MNPLCLRAPSSFVTFGFFVAVFAGGGALSAQVSFDTWTSDISIQPSARILSYDVDQDGQEEVLVPVGSNIQTWDVSADGRFLELRGNLALPGTIATLETDGDLLVVVTSAFAQTDRVNFLVRSPGAAGGLATGTNLLLQLPGVRSIALADLDLDSDVDVVVHYRTAQNPLFSTLAVLERVGASYLEIAVAGVFAPPNGGANGVHAGTVVVGDFQDGPEPEIALINQAQDAIEFVRFNLDNNTTLFLGTLPVADPFDFVAFDSNGDTLLDLALTSGSEVQVYERLSGGGFVLGDSFSTPQVENLLLPFDADDDGDLDLLVSGYESGAEVVLWQNDAGMYTELPDGAQLAFAGVTDGVVSVAAVETPGSASRAVLSARADAQRYTVVFNFDGSGIESPDPIFENVCVDRMRSEDIDGDTFLDLVWEEECFLGGTNTLRWSVGDGAGGFSAPTTIATGLVIDELRVRDLDLNGAFDLVAVGGGEILVFLNDGLGNFGSAITTPIGIQMVPHKIFDVNGDGDLDLVGVAFNELLTFPGDGTGNFGPPDSVPTNSMYGVRSLIVRDFNNDGRADAMVSDSTLVGPTFHAGQVGGVFGAAVTLNGIGVASAVEIAELDGDAGIELLTILHTNGLLARMQFNNNGSIGLRVIGSEPAAGAYDLSDITGDGIDDLLIVSSTSRGFVVWLSDPYLGYWGDGAPIWGVGGLPQTGIFHREISPLGVVIADRVGGDIHSLTGALEEDPFIRGDFNQDGASNIADAVTVFDLIFSGILPPGHCSPSGDANDDGVINVADAIALFGGLFGGGGPIPPPTGTCGPDPTPTGLFCWEFNACP